MIEVFDLTKVFPGSKRTGRTAEAVSSVSFQCARGEIYALLGPNGAGKTTALRMIATTLTPTSGSARVAGYDLLRQPREIRRTLGFLTGNTNLYGRLKAREVLTYFGRLFGLSDKRTRERIEELSSFLGMDDFLDKRCDKLSQGMKQKVNIARSVVHDPDVMIFDEPTAALDVITSRNVVDFILRCRQDQKAVLLSTHVMAEASKLADRIGILHHGRLIAEGTHAQLLQKAGAEDLEDAFLRIAGELPSPA